MLRKRSLLREALHRDGVIVFWTVALFALDNALLLLLPLSIGRFHALAFGHQSMRNQLLDRLPLNLGDSPEDFVGMFSILLLLRWMSGFGSRVLAARLRSSMARHLRERLFEAQIGMPAQILETRGTGRFLLRFSGDLSSPLRWLTDGMLRALADGCFLFALWLMLWRVLPGASHMALSLYGLIAGLLVVALGRLGYKAAAPYRARKSSLLGFIQRSMAGWPSIRALNREPLVLRRFGRKARLLELQARKQDWQLALLPATVPVLVYGSLLLVMAMVIFREQAASPDSDRYLTALLLLVFSGPVLRRCARLPAIWASGWLSLERMQLIFEQARKMDSTHHVQSDWRPNRQGTLTFHSPEMKAPVLFERQDGKERILLAPGEGQRLWFLRLLALENWDAGEIRWDGQPLVEANGRLWRKRVAVISTHFPLQGETVCEAMTYGRRARKNPEAKALFEEAFRDMLPNARPGWEERLVEAGRHLEPDVVLRLLAVRALITRKPILLVDQCMGVWDAPLLRSFKCWWTAEANRRRMRVLWVETQDPPARHPGRDTETGSVNGEDHSNGAQGRTSIIKDRA